MYRYIVNGMHKSSVSLMTVIICIVQEKIKDVTVSGSEGVEMEEHEPGSGVGEDPSSLQLTADGEYIMLSCTL